MPPLPFLNPLIYPLLGTAALRDIVQGSNGAFSAGPGYDMVTGIGVPNIQELIRALTRVS
jgi:kumamolisin